MLQVCNDFKSLLQVNVYSVTGRDDSLINFLDFCYTKYLLFWAMVKCPLIFSLMRDLLKKSLTVLECVQWFDYLRNPNYLGLKDL